MIRASHRCLRLLIVLVIPLLCAGCHRAPAEVQIRQAIHRLVDAVEDGDANATLAPLSEEFDGNDGELDRRSLGNLVRLLKLRGEHAAVTLGALDIERRGSRWMVVATVTLTRGRRVLPEHAGIYRIESAWREEDGTWRCYLAHWKPVL